ncbi:Xaa-Pro peptidase family protein [Roseisolibacter sp. H3M3-2]|uniref:M24 family metallopeptidase n=1 Tax=Roseisolibacter sp. H3M3-2 TaxID=3031323 RepID=UPI0023DB2D5A|nr:Xaa-Pro peptidase family protein [Roseisolibacter sp. H3M3-2]MDF1502701.1 Xaa-Pro peptidase family protein [Roseisolibacter sp. H3M3-2]
MADARPARLAALVAAMQQAHLDALLVTGLPNVRYLTGFAGSSALLLVTHRGEAVLVTDFRYQTQAPEQVGELARVVIEEQSLWAGLWQQLAQLPHVAVVGFESAHLLHRDFQRLLDGGARWTWRPSADLVERLRERKDADEVRRIRDAGAVAVRALERTLAEVRPGLTELTVAGILERALREAGSEGFPFETIVASGERAALPHARAASRELRRGDLLLIDFGAIVEGYCADVTRTVVVGKADDRQRDVYEVVRAANALASAQVRAGQSGRDADALARDYIDGRGFGDAFGHSLGHGIGLEVHEAPRLARSAEATLPPDSVVTIEPGIYLPGWGGVRIEDDVHLSPDGPAVLTHFTRELLELP